MKPRRPFMIEVGNDYVKFKSTGGYTLVDWDGDRFSSIELPNYLIDAYQISGATVVEILDEVRTVVRMKGQ